MKTIIPALMFMFVAFCCSGSEVFQNFEENNGSSFYGSSPNNGITDFGAGNHEGYGSGGKPVYSGRRSMSLVSWHDNYTNPDGTGAHWTTEIYWCRLGVGPQGGNEAMDLKPSENDRLTFQIFPMSHRNKYIYDWEDGREDNVGVVFYDDGNYASQGFEVWTTGTAPWGKWTELKILFSQLPEDLNLHGIRKIEFITYYPGTYYFDEILSTKGSRVYQSFEPSLRNGAPESEFGWKWNDNDFAGLSEGGEPVREGSHSWKVVTQGYWGGTGIQSQEKRYYNSSAPEQTFWHVDLDPEKNDRLVFWVYALPLNGLENNMAVQFYDNGNHFTDDTKVVVWTKSTYRVGEWTRFEIPFSTLPATLDLHDINKLQFQFYWPGTYYIDEIKSVNGVPVILKNNADSGMLEWEAFMGNVKYRLEESLDGPFGPWRTVYYGSAVSYASQRLVPSWYRVRYVEEQTPANPRVFCSEWSEPVLVSPSVSFDVSLLNSGILSWNGLNQTSLFEVASAYAPQGPWTRCFLGERPAEGFRIGADLWYRVRGVFTRDDDQIKEATEWSALQTMPSNRGFVRAEGTEVKDGQGHSLVLQGINLGGSLIIENWMTGLGNADSPAVEDEWTIRNILTERFGEEAAIALLRSYQESYLNAYDFDVLREMGINMVRLPVYYRNFQSDEGEWIRDSQGKIDWAPLDRLVKLAAERGIYVLLDLHGAPGSQSVESHTGRKDYNRLFENSAEGEAFRTRTTQFWEALALHYKDEPMIAGYDLLNEPVGAPSTEVLKNLYDRLYQAVRRIDPNHMVVMEGIWDMDTLPNPSAMSWSNVLYQFHFYLFGSDDNFNAHKEFIDQKIAGVTAKQSVYQVPVMIGEFTAFSRKESWDYYFSKFNEQGWSFAPWSYKFHNPGSNWGLFCHDGYKGDLPKFRAVQSDGTPGDSYETLLEKLSAYDTRIHHRSNQALIACLRNHLSGNHRDQPFIDRLSRTSISPAGDFYVYGKNFGPEQGSRAVIYGESNVCIISWSDTMIHAYLPTSETRTGGLVQVITDMGGSNEKNLIMPASGSTLSEPSLIRGDAGNEVVIRGSGFGDFTGEVSFSHAYENDPASILPVNLGQAAVHVWNDSEIRLSIPSDATAGTTSLGIDYVPGNNNLAPVLDSIGAKTGAEGRTLAFNLKASDPENDSLQYSIEGLPAGAVFENGVFNWVPDYAQAGTYSVVFSVSDGELTDSETVSLEVANVPVADLVLTALTPQNSSVAPGSLVSVYSAVKNIGERDAGAFSISFHLSKDARFGGTDDVDLGKVRSLSSLIKGKSSGTSLSLTVPEGISPGTYFLCACADSGSTVVESNEANNLFCSPVVFNAAPSDLVIREVDFPGEAMTGTSLTVSARVQNEGGGKVSSFYVGFYLSSDPVITSADTRIASKSVSGLEANGSVVLSAVYTISSSQMPGTYYIGAIADYTKVRPEANEDNNSLSGPAIDISPGTDLVMTRVSGPALCSIGQSVEIQNTAANQGPGTAPGFYVGIYLSTDSEITEADRRIASRYISSLKPGESNAALKAFVMPKVTPGTYYIGVIADYQGTRYEVNKQNNSLCGGLITVLRS